MTERDELLAAVMAANPLPEDAHLPIDVVDGRPSFALLRTESATSHAGTERSGTAGRNRWRGPAVATAVMALILLVAGIAALTGRRGSPDEGDAIARAVAPAVARPAVCDLFTDEDVTRIVRDAYLAAGRSTTDQYIPTELVEGTRGGGDSCDWLEPLSAWVVLERLEDGRRMPEWSNGGFYQAGADRTFEPHPAMPPGVEVANVLVRRGYTGDGAEDIWVSIDVRIVDDAPEWWRFSIDILHEDFQHTWDTGPAEEIAAEEITAEEIAWGVAGPMFERIQSGS